MKILIAEDDPVSRRLLEATLTRWGYEVATVCDGTQAWDILQRPDAPRFAILDGMMPGLDGVEVCRRVRARGDAQPAYLILLSARQQMTDLLLGLYAGADDYITKPFRPEELRARVQVGVRVVKLQEALAARVAELGEALARLNQVQGLVPICSYCKKIRADKNYWQQVEAYLGGDSESRFSHGICPDCLEHVVRPQVQKLAAPMP
jgi:DNA-binding response OmpR family regulator